MDPRRGTIGGLRYLATAFHNRAQGVDGAATVPILMLLRGYAKHRALLNETLADWAQFKVITLPRLSNCSRTELRQSRPDRKRDL